MKIFFSVWAVIAMGAQSLLLKQAQTALSEEPDLMAQTALGTTDDEGAAPAPVNTGKMAPINVIDNSRGGGIPGCGGGCGGCSGSGFGPVATMDTEGRLLGQRSTLAMIHKVIMLEQELNYLCAARGLPPMLAQTDEEAADSSW